jgi:hypothetical protein
LLMDQDDAEQRISDLSPSAAPEAESARGKPGRKWRSLATGVWTGIFLVALGVAALAYGAYYSYGYWVGTPTTATVDHCEAGGLFTGSKYGWAQGLNQDPSFYCNGTWSVGGQSQSGPIRPPFSGNDRDGGYKQPGSSLNVHVHHGKAYVQSIYSYLWIVGPILIVWGLVTLRRKWRGRNRA